MGAVSALLFVSDAQPDAASSNPIAVIAPTMVRAERARMGVLLPKGAERTLARTAPGLKPGRGYASRMADAGTGSEITVGEEVPGGMTFEGTLPERMGIVLLEASPERVVATMPVEGNTQPYGLLHGGASVVLAETLGSIGSAMHAARLFNGIAVGIEVNATHHKAARAGLVTGVATPLRLGGMIATYEIAITDESGERICTARLTCALRRS
ncbi:hypothetical protein GCM10022255_006240 [Dactylosporangium darangshiense]|uniref:Thioesterase domain-containing protein n=3 Tax=Dactylosporangium darangshiense TaxID=579108 RepID=A0ABP8CWY2_9ACTN